MGLGPSFMAKVLVSDQGGWEGMDGDDGGCGAGVGKLGIWAQFHGHGFSF